MFHFQESKEITWGAVKEEKALVLCYRKERDERGVCSMFMDMYKNN